MKALIVCGAGGAGKDYILKRLRLGNVKTINSDVFFEKIVTDAGYSLDMKDAESPDLSFTNSAMADASWHVKNVEIPKALREKEPFIYNGTASSYNVIEGLKEEMEAEGFSVGMLFVYAPVQQCLFQNELRVNGEKTGRRLRVSSVFRSWFATTALFEKYQKLFGVNFFPLSNRRLLDARRNLGYDLFLRATIDADVDKEISKVLKIFNDKIESEFLSLNDARERMKAFMRGINEKI